MSFSVYKSSAGSGKTYTLVKEYLKIILLNPNDFRAVLAVTFTNKAANEMKERVISNLKILKNGNTNKDSNVIKYLLPELIKETGLKQESVFNNASKALSLILHNYSDFAISTIDSFVHKIVKTFAYDLKLSLNFDVELDAEKLLTQAIDELINKIGIDRELTELLINYTVSKAEDEKNWHIENDLLSLAKTLTDENSQSYTTLIKDLSYSDFKDLIKILNGFLRQFKKKIIDESTVVINLLDDAEIDFNSLYYGKTGIGNYFKKLTDERNENFMPNSRVTKTIDEDIWYSEKLIDSEKSKIDAVKNRLFDSYSKIQNILEKQLKKYNLYKLLYKQIYPLAVLNEIEKNLSKIKEENNIIHISEFNKLISKIVFTEPVPFIYERIGERYKHFLIDEFQDTSLLQWQNLIPLIENSLSEGHFNMIVGDGKQAIYRWRNGEVEQFSILPEIFRKENLPLSDERENTLKRNFQEEFLQNNYRSKKEIIEFNNDFFKTISSILNDSFQNIYKGVEQSFDPFNTGGYVQLEFVPIADDHQEETDPMLLSLLNIVEEIKSSGRKMSDIALLCRTRNEAKICSLHLLENNIPVLSSESLLLSASEELNLIISFLKQLLDNDDLLSMSNILQYLINKKIIKAQSLTDVFNVIRNTAGDKRNANFKTYLKSYGYNYNIYRLLSLPLYDLLEEIIRLFQFNKKMDPYLQFFMDAALKLTLSSNSNLNDFIDWWEETKDKESIIIPEGINAIQVLTIHKSKGLEFPIVIYPFATANTQRGLNNFWSKYEDELLPTLKAVNLPFGKALAETTYREVNEHEDQKRILDLINLMYVAFTRPMEQLYVLTRFSTKNSGDSFDIPKLIKYYLEQKGCWNEEQTMYEFGSKMFYKPELNLSDKNIKLEKFYSVNWRGNLKISTSAPDIWDVDNPERNKEKGNLIHFLLSQIITIDQIENVVNLNFEKGLFDKSQKKDLINFLQKLISHPKVSPYFEDDLIVKTEAEILLDTGKTIRPDRIVIKENEIIVIDYKTGRPLISHENQISNYAMILRQMGYEKISKVLIYLSSGIHVKMLD
jgi:ATP-dependent exoDNAse (exonuclease V) beta subunit